MMLSLRSIFEMSTTGKRSLADCRRLRLRRRGLLHVNAERQRWLVARMIKYTITVPANTTADVVLPNGTAQTVTAGTYVFP